MRRDGDDVALVRVHDAGLFSGVVPGPAADYRLAVRYGERVDTVDDPYRWLPTLGDMDLHLISEGRHERLWDVLGAHVRSYDPRPARSPEPASRCGRRPRRACGSPVTSTAGPAGRTRCACWAPPGSGSCSCRTSAPAPGTSSGCSARTAAGGRRPTRWPSAPRSRRPRRRSSTSRRTSGATPTWLEARAQRHAHAEPMSVYEVHLGSWKLGLDLPGAGRRAGPLPRRDRVHPHRAAAGGRAPVRRFLGLPGHLLLRADLPLRHPGRLPLLRRPPAPARLRRDRGLGAGALPARRVRAGPLRRHAALRARRPAARRAARLGHAGVRLRPPRGAQLPGGQRAVLARRVPHRRAAGRRGGLHALPGLLPARGPVAAQRLRRPGEPGRGVVPAGDERHGLPRTTPAW